MTAVMETDGICFETRCMAVRTQARLRVLPNRAVSDRADVNVYKRFFLMGALTVLTAGCTLGAVALVGIAGRGSYTTSTWTPYILAHANSQLYGWVGFFIMGFALQQHAPSIGMAKQFDRLAWFSLVLMALGIAVRFAAEPLSAVDRAVWVPIGIASCWAQAIAVMTFLFNTTYTRHRSGQGLTWQSAFVLTSLSWLFVISVAEPFAFAYSHAADQRSSIMFVAKWFPVLRDAQFLGFVTMMIFGVALTKLNSCFAIKEAHKQEGVIGYGLWMAGLLVRMVGWLRYDGSGFEPGTGTMYFAGGVLLAFGAATIAWSLRVFEPAEEPQRAHKFVRGAIVWLLISGVLLILEPIHLRQIHAPFSHAYIGAIRHAVTVGVISQMIIGFSIHIIPRLRGIADANLTPLWITFWLLNLGNAGRVFLQIASDYTPAAFAPMGMTGFIELVGLFVWAGHVLPLLVKSVRSPRSSHAL